VKYLCHLSVKYHNIFKVDYTKEDEEEDVRSYWMTLRTGEDTLI